MATTKTFVDKLISTIPGKPVDGFKINFYRLYVNPQCVSVYSMEYVYYINTPWETYDPTRKGGADLVDDWMLNKDGYCEGRICGWKNIAEHLRGQKSTMFESKAEALHDAIQHLDKWIAQDVAKITQMQALKAEQQAELRTALEIRP